MTLARRLVAEGVGTALLLLAIVGSGIATATGASASTELFQHAVTVGATLLALIAALGPVSGAHFNPAVTLADLLLGGMTARVAGGYVAAQLVGALTGAVTANLTFGENLVAVAGTARSGAGLVASEAIVTAGLVLVIVGVVRSATPALVSVSVAAYIAAGIFATSSTAFANPAVTVARTVSDTFTGIAPSSVPGFLAAQLVGALAATGLAAWLFQPSPEDARDLVVPRTATDDAPGGSASSPRRRVTG